jgi:hypothetical protein
VIRALTIRENAKLMRLSESLRRTSRSISAAGRYVSASRSIAPLPPFVDAHGERPHDYGVRLLPLLPV